MKTQQQQHQTTTTYSDPDAALLENLIAEAARLQEIANRATPQELRDKAELEKALRIANALDRLRSEISNDMMRSIMALAGSSLGFRTDRDNQDAGYPIPVVKDCWIEATLKGARPTGNEWNIIAGRCYLTKEFYQRSFPSLPGVTDVECVPGVPRLVDGKTQVRMAVRWKFHGEPCELKDTEGKPGRVFVIRVNSGMGDDAVIGKATRKALKAAYDQVAGFDLGDPDDEPITAPTTPLVANAQALLDRAKVNGVAKQQAESPTRENTKNEAKAEPQTDKADDIEQATKGAALLGMSEPRLKSHLNAAYKADSITSLDGGQLKHFIQWIDRQLEKE